MSVSEFCLDYDFSTIIFSNLYLLCSFIYSNPLYFSYFVFFSPHLFKLFSFLSPLLLTTSLLLLALITHHHEFQESEFEELDVYKIVFQGFTFEVREEDPDGDLEVGALVDCEEEPIDKCVIEGGTEALWPEIDREVEEEFLKGKDGKVEDLPWEMEEIKAMSIEAGEVDESHVNMGYLYQEEFLKENDGKVENLSLEKEEIKALSTESNNVAEQEAKEEFSNRRDRKVENLPWEREEIKPMSLESKKVAEQEAKQSTDHDEFETPKALSRYPSFDPSLSSYGSMRKEKEWKRTLACKLFEERHNAKGGAEGMDMLWETYEAEPRKVQLKNPKNGSYGDDNDDDDEDEVGVQLCCLQALKFSAGKMSLGMGRPSLVRFSKAVKGMRWLQHHVSKAGKKGTYQ